MGLTDEFILPQDVDIRPIAELPEHTRAQFAHDPDDWAVTRHNSRATSRIVNEDLARLLLLFRGGSTVARAVAAFSLRSGLPAEEVLREALPSLNRFIGLAWLAPVGSRAAVPLGQGHPIGATIAGYRLVDCLQVLENSEIYQATDQRGDLVALKLVPHPVDRQSELQLRAEISALGTLDGRPASRLLDHGVVGEDYYLALEWCDGVPVTTRAEELRQSESAGALERLHRLCVRVIEAYSALHGRGVVHGDVHPGNVLVDTAGAIRLIDFGLSTSPGMPRTPLRGGVPSFTDPQCAADWLAGRRPGQPDQRAEQYSVAALAFLVLTGEHHVEQAAEREVLLGRIAANETRSFDEVGVAPAAQLEAVLARALSGGPPDRFPSTAAFLDAFRRAEVPVRGSRPRPVDRGAARDYVAVRLARLRRRLDADDRRADEGPHGTVTFGSAGIACGLHRIALHREDPDLLAEADHWAAKAVAEIGTDHAVYHPELDITEESVGRSSPYHTESGVHAVQAVVAQSLGDFAAVRESVDHYLRAATRPTENIDLTLGRTGVLLANALLLEAIEGPTPGAESDDLRRRLRDLGDAIAASVWAELDVSGPIGAGNVLPFLGVAHGWAGVCYASLVWCAVTGANEPVGLRGRIEELAAQATPDGPGLRWPIQTHARGRRHNFMNSWCNGSPGYVFLWNAAHARFDDPRFAELADGAARETWERRDPLGGICCGSTGRAYALLNHHRHRGEAVWLERARALAEAARRAPYPAVPDSLYKGETGTVVLTAELEDPSRARLPFFECDR